MYRLEITNVKEIFSTTITDLQEKAKKLVKDNPVLAGMTYEIYKTNEANIKNGYVVNNLPEIHLKSGIVKGF